MHRTLRNGYNKLSGATGPNKLMQNMKPKFFHQTSQHETVKLKENVSPKGEFRSKLQKCSPLGADKESDKSAQKKPNHIKYLHSKSKIERVPTVGHVLANNENSNLSENSRKRKEVDENRKKEEAALLIRMTETKEEFSRIGRRHFIGKKRPPGPQLLKFTPLPGAHR